MSRERSSPPEAFSHANLSQRLKRLESTVSAIPQGMSEFTEGLNQCGLSGIKVAGLLETLFEDTPMSMLALRFRDGCELFGDKCNKSGTSITQEISGPVKKIAPSLSKLRSRLESHLKAQDKYETYENQLDQLKAQQTPNKQKIEHVEAKLNGAMEEFVKEDKQLARGLDELNRLRVEVMGPCFLSMLEAYSKLLTSAAEIMGPLGAYKEAHKGVPESSTSSLVREAVLGWLAAAQVNHNLRSFGGLSRNDVQCMLYNGAEGLPEVIRSGLNKKVDHLLKLYTAELQLVPSPHHRVMGGFHLNPKGIELALRDCCSELEGIGAGAPHAETREDKQLQVERDVPRTSFKIGGKLYGCASGDLVKANIEEKLGAITVLVSQLPLCSQMSVSDSVKDDFAFHVLNEGCTTVTNTVCKTAVQLVFGKANLVLVRPAPNDNRPIEMSAIHSESAIQITVQSSWWIIEDYAALVMLTRPLNPTAYLGQVESSYTITLSLQNFMSEDSVPELPMVAVSYSGPHQDLDNTNLLKTSAGDSKQDSSKTLTKIKEVSKRFLPPSRPPARPARPTFRSYLKSEELNKEGEGEEEGEEEGSTHSEPSVPSSASARAHTRRGVVHEAGGNSGSGRGAELRMRRSGSDDDDDASSRASTVKPQASVPSMDFTDLLSLSSTRHQPTLTLSGLQAFTKSEAGKQKGYLPNHVPSWDKDPGERNRGERAGGSLADPNIFIASEEGIQNAINALSWGNTTDGHTGGTPHDEVQDQGYAPRGTEGHSQDHSGGQGQDYTGGQEHSYGFSSRYETRQSRGGHKKPGSGGAGGSEEDLPAREVVAPRESRKLQSPSEGLEGGKPFGEEQVPRPTKQGSKLSVSSDSGISLPQPAKWSYEFPSADVSDMTGGKESQELSDSILSKGFGPFYLNRDYLHDSDSEGRASVPPALSSGSESPMGSLSAAMKSAHSEEHLPATRSDSRHSWHALPPARGPSLFEDSFNHAPGSRVISQSHYASDYEALSQESGDDGRVSLSQGSLGMRHRSTENLRHHRHPHHHPHDQLSSAFDFNERGMPPPPMIGGYSAYDDPRGQRSSFPYPGPHPPRPNQSRERDEFSPSPGPPPLDARHGMGPGPGMGPGYGGMGPGPGGMGPGPGGMGPGPGGMGPGPGPGGMGPPGPYWHSFNYGPPRPGPNMGPMAPPMGPYQSGPPPPHMTENRYRFRSNTPEGQVSLHGMSPAPSPHPTPPTTPPPPNSGHLLQGPPPPPMMMGPRMQVPPPGMGPGHGPHHPMMGPPPWEHGFDNYSVGPPPPPPHALPQRAHNHPPPPPPPMGHGPSMHGPPMHGRFPPDYRDRDWKHH